MCTAIVGNNVHLRYQFLRVNWGPLVCFFVLLFVASLNVSTSAMNCPEKLIFEATYYASIETLNSASPLR